MIKLIFKYLAFLNLAVNFIACSAATGSRYSNSMDDVNEELTDGHLRENSAKIVNNSPISDLFFDMTPYRTNFKINLPDNKGFAAEDSDDEIWYSYDQDTESKTELLTSTKTRGYRVLVISTDYLEEANQIKSDIYFITNQKQVYLSFEPPFYKVKVGDYTQITDANNLQFKLNQMGYSESRVVSEEVNIFK